MTEQLKPCPFCGASAKVKKNKTTMVSCTECGASTFQQLNDSESAISTWNKREAAAGAPDLRSAPTLLSRRLRDSATAEVGFLHAKLLINAAEEIERLASAAPVEALTDDEIIAICERECGWLAGAKDSELVKFARAIEARINGGAK